jgi:NADH-quinone oxidoreductase subunit L
MPLMGGLRKKMPITAYTMLVGCLAISGISIPFLVGFSGYYSKDRILEQAYVFQAANASILADLVFYAAAGGAAITAFYMFRLWYLTFAGQPRDEQRYRHAHESPRVMTAPLLLLAFFATTIAWQLPAGLGWLSDVNLANLLEQSRPLGMHGDTTATLVEMTWPDEHFAHQPEQHAWVVVPITWLATLTAWAGIALATAMYWRGVINPAEVRKQFEPLYQFLVHKWWFDELYDRLLIRPTLAIGRRIAGFDRRWIDGAIDGLARFTRAAATVWDRVADRTLIDGSIDTLAAWTYGLGLRLRGVQTGRLRQYVMFIVIGAVALFVVISFFWSPSLAR